MFTTPKKNETLIFNDNDKLNVIFPPNLTLMKSGTGIRLMFCPDINEMTVEADFSSYQIKPPVAQTDALHDLRKMWWYMVTMIPPFFVDTTSTTTTTTPSVKVGTLFHNNNIAYRILSFSHDNRYCNCQIVNETNDDQITMEITTIRSYIDKQNKK